MSTDTLRGERVLITGGGGAIGSHLTDQVIRAGASEVIVVDNFVRGRRENLDWAKANGNLNLVEGDICDFDLMRQLTEGVNTVFHMAAIRITQCVEEPRLAVEIMVNGTQNVLDAAVEHKVRRVVAASSASVYGLAEEFPTTERHHPYNNDTLYGAAKAFNEGMLRSYRAMYDLDYVALRYFNVYGARMDIHGVYTEVLVRWMERIENGEPPIIHGDGLQTMDFVCIEDIARANVLAASIPHTDVVYNIACGVETSLRELAEKLCKVMGREDLDVEFGPARAAVNVTRRLADTSRATAELGWTAEIDLDEGLKRLVEWWRAEQKLKQLAAS